jgi:predicted kinase
MELLMLVGIPTSGKSSYVDTLLEQDYWKSAAILSTDNYIEQAANSKGVSYDEMFASAVGPPHQFLDHQLTEAIESQTPIIWDQTNLTIKTRNKKLQRIPFWWRRQAVYFEISLEEALARNQFRAGKVIPKGVLTKMFNDYQRPTYSEGFDLIIGGDENG